MKCGWFQNIYISKLLFPQFRQSLSVTVTAKVRKYRFSVCDAVCRGNPTTTGVCWCCMREIRSIVSPASLHVPSHPHYLIPIHLADRQSVHGETSFLVYPTVLKAWSRLLVWPRTKNSSLGLLSQSQVRGRLLSRGTGVVHERRQRWTTWWAP